MASGLTGRPNKTQQDPTRQQGRQKAREQGGGRREEVKVGDDGGGGTVEQRLDVAVLLCERC
jgi:hypothetical protein